MTGFVVIFFDSSGTQALSDAVSTSGDFTHSIALEYRAAHWQWTTDRTASYGESATTSKIVHLDWTRL